MRLNVLFRLFRVCILLLETISPFESHLLFDLSFKFTLLYGNAILKQCKNVPKNVSKEQFTSKQLYISFHNNLDSRCLNSSILLCVNCLLSTVEFSYFFYQYLFSLFVRGGQRSLSL